MKQIRTSTCNPYHRGACKSCSCYHCQYHKRGWVPQLGGSSGNCWRKRDLEVEEPGWWIFLRWEGIVNPSELSLGLLMKWIPGNLYSSPTGSWRDFQELICVSHHVTQYSRCIIWYLQGFWRHLEHFFWFQILLLEDAWGLSYLVFFHVPFWNRQNHFLILCFKLVEPIDL